MKIGQTISHYKILEKLGEGGMGVVYKAKDIRLERTVALKMLRSEAIGDPDAKKRFLREARAACVLSHTNITTIHEIDEWQGQDFIVIEYVEGKTIQEIIKNEKLKIKNVIEYAIQICDALKEAHEFQIIHRDIKSGNIIITPLGRIKVMDFGLAKIAGVVTKTKTHPTMGTIAYMSPEQTKGKGVDFRTDIWSFGVVLYEMLTNELPFKGDYEQAIIYSILNEEPEKMNVLRPDIPQQLENIVNKALSKNKQERFDSAQDLLKELDSVSESKTVIDFKNHKRKTNHLPSEETSKWTRKKGLLAALLLLLLIIPMAFIFYHIKKTPLSLSPTSQLFTSLQGAEKHPSLSPSGHILAFVWSGEKQDNWDIYLKAIGNDGEKRLTTNPASEHSPTWSSDELCVAYVRLGAHSGIYCKSILGEKPAKKLVDLNQTDHHPDINAYVDWAPDNKWLVFSDFDSLYRLHVLYRLDIQTLLKKQITFPDSNLLGDTKAKISPDGSLLAFIRVYSHETGDIFVLNLIKNKLKHLTSDKRQIDDLAWTADSKKIVFSSNRDGISRLWSVSKNGGIIEPVKIGGQNARQVSISRKNSRLAFSIEHIKSDIWQADLTNKKAGKIHSQRLLSSSTYDTFPVYSPHNRFIAFSSARTGWGEMFKCDADGSNIVQLTFLNASSGCPRWSPSGDYILFDTRLHGDSEIYVVDAHGVNPAVNKTNNPADDRIPSWSRDGDYFYFSSNRNGTRNLFKKPVMGGKAVQLTHNGAGFGFESFDSKYVFFMKGDKGETNIQIGQINLSTKEESIVIDEKIYAFCWVVNPQGIYYMIVNDNNEPLLKLYRYPERTTEDIGILEKWCMFSDVSDDGKYMLLWFSENYSSDIYLVDNFQ